MRDNSRLFYAECTAFPSPMAVKICLSPHTLEADPDSAHRQYAALLRVSEAMGEATDFCVPRPYLLRADVGLLAMEWIAGRSMTELVFSWRCSLGQACELMARSARWLRCFHACHALAPGQLDVEPRLAFLDELETSRTVSDPVFFRALGALRHSANAATAIMLNRSWTHGDFKTDNLIVSGRRTVGVDVHLRHENTVIYDLAMFLNHLALRLCHPAGWRLARSQSVLRETFLANYFPVRNDTIMAPLAWIQLYLLLQGWHTGARAGSWLRSSLVGLCYRTIALRLAGRMAHVRAAMPHSDAA